MGSLLFNRYRNRFWRETVFDGVELVKNTLDEVYGKDKVSLVSSVFRWMNHHSKMEGDGKSLSLCSSKLNLINQLGRSI